MTEGNTDSWWDKILDGFTGGDEDDDQGAAVDAGTGAASALPVTANNTTLTAEGFVNSVGVGTHLAYLDTSYGQVDAVKLVKDLGVENIRDGLGSNDSVPIASMKRASEAGVSINWVSQPVGSSFSIDDQLAVIKDNDLNVTSVEGVNEFDNRGDADWVGKVREHQNTLYDAVKAALGGDVAVVAPSLVHDESRAELGEVKSDIANSHPYTGGEMQTPEQTEHQVAMAAEVTPDVDTTVPAQAEGQKVDLKAAVEDSGAMWATETGFHTATDSTAGGGVQPHVSEQAQAVLELQQLLSNYASGVDRTYIYELLDEGDDNGQAEDRFGLAHADGSPKPVFTALKNLLAIVRSGGPAGTAGTAAATVEVSGGSDVTTHVVLPRADGSTVVAVWEAAPVWDTQSSRDLEVPEHDVTLNLGAAADAEVFVPGEGAQAVDSQDDTTVVRVSSQATPTIVVLAPTGANSGGATSGASSTPTPAATAPSGRPAVTPTSTSTSPSSPSSGLAAAQVPRGDLPGWRQVLAEDFTRDAPLGDFVDTYRDVATVYDDGARDTSGRGLYDPARVLSVSNGVLDWWVHTEDGQPLVGAVLPTLPTYGQTYGRYSVRYRADEVEGFKTAFLLWPDSEQWPDDGEIDFPEGSLDGTVYAASHLAQPWTGKHESELFETPTGYDDWHIATTEWTPGKVEFFLDGASIGTATVKTPTTPMHWVLQVETNTDGAAPQLDAQGHVQVDWVAAWSRDPTSAGPGEKTEPATPTPSETPHPLDTAGPKTEGGRSNHR